jgi:hypothetical protein
MFTRLDIGFTRLETGQQAVLRELREAKTVEKGMSEASRADVERALRQGHFARVSKFMADEEFGEPLANFVAYKWKPLGPSLSESEATVGDDAYPSLIFHLWSQLPLGMCGELFHADARQFPLSFRVEAHDEKVPLFLNGHPDVALVDSRFAAPGASSCPDNCCLLIDWKTPTAMADTNRVENQLLFQLLGYNAMYGRPIPVVATDLSTAIRVWCFDGEELAEYFCDDRKPLALSQGIRLAFKLGLEASKALARLRKPPRRKLSVVPEDDNAEGHGGGGAGGKETGGGSGREGPAGAGGGAAGKQGNAENSEGSGSSAKGGRAPRGNAGGRSAVLGDVPDDSNRWPIPEEEEEEEEWDEALAEMEAKQRLRSLLWRTPGLEHLAHAF